MPIDNRDYGRLGKAVEDLVAATCILTSGLQLNVSTSFVDDEGVDLVFARRGQPKTLVVQVKSRRLAGTSLSIGTFRTQVRDATFVAREDLCMLFVAVDPDEGTFDLAWLVPSIDFRGHNRELTRPAPVCGICESAVTGAVVSLPLFSSGSR